MITLQDKLARVEKIKNEKVWWLSDFCEGKNKRPDHELENRRIDVEILEAVAQDYRNAIARKAEGEAA
ncbi:hypothetical protein R5W60_04135 [Brucella pseudintermedia]|uniref:hypothetical protein n=1 Tax=Brucella pseudintermedia TaxID=370111 RepID=UPI003673432C|nr:hypothetical protein R5W60_04135 [Brucella pseudintermedia]